MIKMSSESSSPYDFRGGKRYCSLAERSKALYGTRLQKLVIDAGFTCPNRDGSKGRGGCFFCDNRAFHPCYSSSDKDILLQLEEGIEFHKVRYRRSGGYIAYFQSFSNTYAPVEVLREKYFHALSHPLVVGLAVATRPDCVNEENIALLAEIRSGKALPGWKRRLRNFSPNGEITAPLVSLELGIESVYDETLRKINRLDDFASAKNALALARKAHLPAGGHFIIGLPDETVQMLLDEVCVINTLPLDSLKFHQLQFIKGTPMEKWRKSQPGRFLTLVLPDYLDLVADMLERLRPDIAVERVAGEVPPRFVEGSPWGAVRNTEILRMLDANLEERNTWQGRLFRKI